MDLFDVANELSSTVKIEHLPVYRDSNGSYQPLTNMFFKGFATGTCVAMTNEDGDRIIFVTTDFGNVVLHERIRSDNFVIAVAPKSIQPLLGRGKLTEDQITMVLGLWGKDNIGQVLSNLTKYKQDKVA